MRGICEALLIFVRPEHEERHMNFLGIKCTQAQNELQLLWHDRLCSLTVTSYQRLKAEDTAVLKPDVSFMASKYCQSTDMQIFI